MKHKKISLLFALFATVMPTVALHSQQLFATDFTPGRVGMLDGCRHLNLDVEAGIFFFDAEYSAPTAKGYTVTGMTLAPTMVYGLNERAMLRVGFQASMFAGLDSLYCLRPTLTLIYRAADWIRLVAGTLAGPHRKHLPEPLCDIADPIFHPYEEGLQILTNTSRWRSDTWLNWHHYLTPGTPDQEHFTLGTMHEVALWASGGQLSAWTVSIPLLFMARHRGGEVKSIDTNTVTTFNEELALRLRRNHQNPTAGNSSCFTAEMPLFLYHLEDTGLDNGGHALYPTLSYQFTHIDKNELKGWNIDIKAGFWHGNHFFSSAGSPLFWSVNPYTAMHIPSTATGADIRNLLTCAASIGHRFKNLEMGLQVDAIHDFAVNKQDFIFSFYMRMNEHFMIF